MVRPSSFACLLLALLLSACGRTAVPGGGVHSRPRSDAGYRYRIDLTDRTDDRFRVVLTPPALPAGEAVFQLPATVPGTYEIEDWGRMVVDLRAIAVDGGPIAVRRDGVNRFVIADGASLGELRYEMDDSLDAGLREHEPYPMASTDIDHDHVVINPFGVFGYFEGAREVPFETVYRLPPGWEAASALVAHQRGDELTYRARDYDDLVDAPVLMGELDLRTLRVAGTEIVIALFAPPRARHGLDADATARAVEPVLEATARWLGGLPVQRYAFLVRTGGRMVRGGIFGAHEHRTSSFYYLPAGIEVEQVAHMAAHEFFHIVTPLNLRSDIIDEFDFATPRPSRHLWFYEGVTEYCSWHLRAKGGLIGERAFFGQLRDKLFMADGYDWELPLIELGLGCYDRHADEYGNVYQKAALVAWALDLEIQRLSGGATDLRDTIRTLIGRYGPDRPFAEDELFGAIAAACGQPGVIAFLEAHVAGGRTPDFDALLAPVGLDYLPVRAEPWVDSRWPVMMPVDGAIVVWGLAVEDVPEGFLPGDRVVEIDGAPADAADLPALAAREAGLPPGETVRFTVVRGEARLELECTSRAGSVGVRHALRARRVLDAETAARRRRWLSYPGGG